MATVGERRARAGTASRDRRDEAAVAVFGTWMLTGLFLDGWAHQADKPETFFSPWHLLLYSGFVAAVAWFAVDGRRRGTGTTPADRWLTAGLVLFVTGAVGDGIWHEVFGIEVDLEALLSPTHLLLFIGGFLMVTFPLREAIADTDEVRPAWPAWWPQAVTLTLATALVGFFTMYLTVLDGIGGGFEEREALGIGSVLVTNAVLLLPSAFVLRRWDPPTGTFLLLFSTFGVAMSGLTGFRQAELAVAFVVGGVALEVLRRTTAAPVAAAGTSTALWATFVAAVALTDELPWTVELWSGGIVLAAASSALLVVLTDSSERTSRG
jgi:hypothetical protein